MQSPCDDPTCETCFPDESCDHCGAKAVTVQFFTGRAACDDHARKVFPECFAEQTPPSTAKEPSA